MGQPVAVTDDGYWTDDAASWGSVYVSERVDDGCSLFELKAIRSICVLVLVFLFVH